VYTFSLEENVLWIRYKEVHPEIELAFSEGHWAESVIVCISQLEINKSIDDS